ncbi:MAG: hypothetical protein LUC22_02295 [Prevotella sp.]|nr:hypothetical protein [Prevotella sp.]
MNRRKFGLHPDTCKDLRRYFTHGRVVRDVVYDRDVPVFERVFPIDKVVFSVNDGVMLYSAGRHVLSFAEPDEAVEFFAKRREVFASAAPLGKSMRYECRIEDVAGL